MIDWCWDEIATKLFGSSCFWHKASTVRLNKEFIKAVCSQTHFVNRVSGWWVSRVVVTLLVCDYTVVNCFIRTHSHSAVSTTIWMISTDRVWFLRKNVTDGNGWARRRTQIINYLLENTRDIYATPRRSTQELRGAIKLQDLCPTPVWSRSLQPLQLPRANALIWI